MESIWKKKKEGTNNLSERECEREKWQHRMDREGKTEKKKIKTLGTEISGNIDTLYINNTK